MKLRKIILFVSLLFLQTTFGQVIEEVSPPFQIKTASFTQFTNNVVPIFQLGDPFQFSFDDLFGSEENYYFTIDHFNYNWTPSQLTKNEYLEGNDNQRILDYENSFNTLQIYSHYRLDFPNRFVKILKSGNYLLSILNNDREVILTRKFIIYENLAKVGMEVKRARVVNDLNDKQNLYFSITSKDILFQNPLKNVRVLLLQNGIWNNAIYNIKPQYTIGNDLIYKYDKETQFYAGNEYLFFDNKEIRVATNNIRTIDATSGLYKSFLYTNNARKNDVYTFYPDVNGNFKIRNFSAQNSNIEADYSWVYFNLFVPEASANDNIYVTGMFNNNTFSEENKMEYNKDRGVFEKAILIKQGFVNYKYTMLNADKNIMEKEAVDGNFYQTENNYTALVYYRENGERYDRVIGKGEANSIDITN